MRTIDKRKEKAERRAVWLRNYQRARGRALTKLAQQYPDQYKEILEQERLSDEANGKTWLDITGATDNSAGVLTNADGYNNTLRSEQADADEQNEGYLGEKNENRKLAKQYAWAAFGWERGVEVGVPQVLMDQ